MAWIVYPFLLGDILDVLWYFAIADYVFASSTIV